MSKHHIVYDLESPSHGTFVCEAAPDDQCRAVFDCSCEIYFEYHVENGLPHHYSTYADGIQVRGHHVGKFDPTACSLMDWHDNSDECVRGEIRVDVTPDFTEEWVEFEATAASLYPKETP